VVKDKMGQTRVKVLKEEEQIKEKEKSVETKKIKEKNFIFT
jgi:hypothetical protein